DEPCGGAAPTPATETSVPTGAVLAAAPVTSPVTPGEVVGATQVGATAEAAVKRGVGAAVAVGAGVGVDVGAAVCVAPGPGVAVGTDVGAGVGLGGGATTFTANVAADALSP